MTRSSKAQRAERLNAAYALLNQDLTVSQAAQRLSQRFNLSRRQSYRYLKNARVMEGPLEAVEAPVAMTIKVPGTLAAGLRAHARRTGQTIGEIVARALTQLLAKEGRNG